MKPIILAFLLATLFSGCHDKKSPGVAPPPTVTAFRVEATTIPATFEFVGVAKSSHPVEIRSRVEGYLDQVAYLEGSLVKKDQLLFQIDPRPFEASLEAAKGELARQEAVLWTANQSLHRLTPLFAKNAVSQRDLDNATGSVLAAEAAVLTAKANVVQAELNLSFTHITAPLEGLSGRAIYREGNLITPAVNGLLTYVSVLDPIWVVFNISDLQLLQGRAESRNQQIILPSQDNYTVTLTLSDGSPFPEKGTVNFAAPILDPDTGTMTIRATFPNPTHELLPGQFVKAKIDGAIRPSALFVPQEAVAQGQKSKYVFVINADQTVSTRDVQVGEWYKNYWIITSGLQSGDLVVAEGTNKLQQGSKVHVQSTTSPSGS